MILPRKYLVSLARTSQFERLVAYLASRNDQRDDLLRVLTYHRVDELDARPDLYPGLISATPEQFALQMEHLQQYYHVVSLPQVMAAIQDEVRLPPRAVLLTFDDAYRDFAQHAWPILKRCEMPAVLFVPTAFPDAPGQYFWWDRLHHAFQEDPDVAGSSFGSLRGLLNHVKSLPDEEVREYVDQICQGIGHGAYVNPVMGWAELRKLADEGLVLAPHTRTHPLMNRISLDAAVEQATTSRDDLLREIGRCPDVFAYPGGAYCDRLPHCMQESGFELAFTTCRGINDLRTADRMQLRRINVQHSTPHGIVCGQLLSMSRHFNRMWPLQSAI